AVDGSADGAGSGGKNWCVKCWLIILALGCGSQDSAPPSQLETCKAYCLKQKTCNLGMTEAEVQICQQGCDSDAMQDQMNDATLRLNCSNADVILRAIYNCYQQHCDTMVAQGCAQDAAASCIEKQK